MGNVKRFTQLCSILSLVMGLTTFLGTQVFLGMPLVHSFIISLSMIMGVFIVSFLDRRLKLGQKLITSLRNAASGSTEEDVMITKWRTDIDVNTRGNATLSHTIEGRVRRGDIKWLEVSIVTDNPQPSKDEGFKVKILDLLNGEKSKPEYLIDEPRYKRVRINFPEAPLREGRKFKYRISAKLLKNFPLTGVDSWYHKVLSNQKKVEISVNFPNGCVINNVFGQAITTHGHNRSIATVPKKLGSRLVRWTIRKPVKGTSYKLNWNLTRKK